MEEETSKLTIVVGKKEQIITIKGKPNWRRLDPRAVVKIDNKHYIRCPYCLGSGRVYMSACPKCKGVGICERY